MTELEKNKLKKRIARQQAKANDAMSRFTTGSGKKGQVVKFSQNRLWKHNDERIS